MDICELSHIRLKKSSRLWLTTSHIVRRMRGAKKTSRKVLAENVERLFELSGRQSEQTLAKRGHTKPKNLNNARNGVNLELDTLDGVAKTFGLQTWELLVPNLDVDKARL